MWWLCRCVCICVHVSVLNLNNDDKIKTSQKSSHTVTMLGQFIVLHNGKGSWWQWIAVGSVLTGDQDTRFHTQAATVRSARNTRRGDVWMRRGNEEGLHLDSLHWCSLSTHCSWVLKWVVGRRGRGGGRKRGRTAAAAGDSTEVILGCNNSHLLRSLKVLGRVVEQTRFACTRLS